ncbi:hypothetical protein AB1285_19075 [Microbacterium sp. NRRL B-14842]
MAPVAPPAGIRAALLAQIAQTPQDDATDPEADPEGPGGGEFDSRR